MFCRPIPITKTANYTTKKRLIHQLNCIQCGTILLYKILSLYCDNKQNELLLPHLRRKSVRWCLQFKIRIKPMTRCKYICISIITRVIFESYMRQLCRLMRPLKWKWTSSLKMILFELKLPTCSTLIIF